MSDRCSACGAALIWALTPAGAKMPVNQALDKERGNVLLQAPAQLGRQVIAVTLSGEALALARRTQAGLRLEHHVSCPDAKLFS